MPGNTFGQIFRVSTFGESHGECVGALIDGCPAGLEIYPEDIQVDLDRRRPGQSEINSPRDEKDKIHIMSGISDGITTGAPILLMVFNEDMKPQDYSKLKDVYRPGHADFTYEMKYGIRNFEGGGRSSARETLARVAAGTIAKKYLKEKAGIEFLSYVEQVGDIKAEIDFHSVTVAQIEENIIRCPDQKVAAKMIDLIKKVKEEGDSLGGIVRGVVKNVPVGLGEPVFDKLHADLGKAMLSINAVKGFDIGLGFDSVNLRGSEHNDEFTSAPDGKISTKTNNAGGVLGGISNGETIYFRVAIKPVSTIRKQQNTVNKAGEAIEIEAEGRHDPCVLPRAVPIVDAMAAIVMMDHYLRNIKVIAF